VGAFAAVGITAGMLRDIQSWMELDIGVQARFP
jgi:regulator of RNase E activity RraA